MSWGRRAAALSTRSLSSSMLPATPEFLALIHAADPRPCATAPGQLDEPSERWRPLLGAVAKHDPGRLHHCRASIPNANTTHLLAPKHCVGRRLVAPALGTRHYARPRARPGEDLGLWVPADVHSAELELRLSPGDPRRYRFGAAPSPACTPLLRYPGSGLEQPSRSPSTRLSSFDPRSSNGRLHYPLAQGASSVASNRRHHSGRLGCRERCSSVVPAAFPQRTLSVLSRNSRPSCSVRCCSRDIAIPFAGTFICRHGPP